MTTFTATPDNASATVDLVLDQTSSVTALTRTNANGIFDVRTAAGQLPTGTTGTTVVTDYEPAQGVNTYTAYVDDVTDRINYVTNPVPASTAGYSHYVGTGTAAWSFVTGAGYAYARLTKDAALASSAGIYLDNATVTVPLNSPIYMTVAVRCSNTTTGFPRNGSSTAGPTVDLPAGQWVTLTLNGYITPGTTFRPSFQVNMIDAGATVDVRFSQWSLLPGPYFDGSTTPAPDDEYSWTGTANASTSLHRNHVRTVAASATVDIDRPWLLVPIAPNYSEQVETITNYSAGRETFSTVHQIIGRPDPIVAMGKLGTRKGSLEIFTTSLADAARVTRVFDRGEAVLLKQEVEGLDMYLVALNLDVSPYEAQGQDTRWKLTVDYQEVIRPGGDLAGALGWTFDALALAYPSFTALKGAYATFDDLTLGALDS